MKMNTYDTQSVILDKYIHMKRFITLMLWSQVEYFSTVFWIESSTWDDKPKWCCIWGICISDIEGRKSHERRANMTYIPVIVCMYYVHNTNSYFQLVCIRTLTAAAVELGWNNLTSSYPSILYNKWYWMYKHYNAMQWASLSLSTIFLLYYNYSSDYSTTTITVSLLSS